MKLLITVKNKNECNKYNWPLLNCIIKMLYFYNRVIFIDYLWVGYVENTKFHDDRTQKFLEFWSSFLLIESEVDDGARWCNKNTLHVKLDHFKQFNQQSANKVFYYLISLYQSHYKRYINMPYLFFRLFYSLCYSHNI